MLLSSDDSVQIQVALLLFAIGAFTDYLDGFLARKMNLQSNLGKFLDPLADKVLTLSAFIAFYLLGIIPLWAVIILAGRDIMTTLMRVYADSKDYDMKTSGNAKVKTFLQMGYIIYVLFLIIGKTNAESLEEVNLYIEALQSDIVIYGLYLLLIHTIFTLIDYFIANRALFSKRYE